MGVDKMGKHWLDGLWHFEDFKFMLHEVKGEVCYWKNLGAFDYPDLGIDSVQGTWEYGKFGETSAEVRKTTGADTYNVEIKLYGGKITKRGVLSEDGKTTTAQLLAKDHGMVYYEADGFLNMINPYIP